jgi:hypothetical protein
MHSKLTTILIILAIALLLPSSVKSKQIQPLVKAEETTVQPEPEVPLSPTQYADKYAKQYGVDPVIFKKVMFCESHNKQSAIGDSGRAVGVFQFHKGTFDGYAKKLGKTLDINSYRDQIELAAYMFSIGEARHWTAYRAVMNGGTYSFYSTLLQKHYTVACK